MAVAKKYVILDRDGQPILYVERPARLILRVLAVLAGIVAAPIFGVAVWILLSYIHNNRVQIVLAFVALIGSIIVLFAVSIWLAPLRHVTVYRDKTKQEALLRVLQAWKWGMIARHTVTDAFGEVLARVRTNRLRNFLVLKEWRCYAPDDSLLCIVKEESAVTWLLRQLGSWLFLVAKTNFILCHGVPEKVIGRFNRNIEILNRYSLDLSADSEKTMDRRIAVAIGVIIDMDEKPWVA